MFDAGDNSETGFLCCPKCLFDVIYDEKQKWTISSIPGTESRILFLNSFIYDYDRGDYEIRLDKQYYYHNYGIKNWFLYRQYFSEEGCDKLIKERELKIKSGKYRHEPELIHRGTIKSYDVWAYSENDYVHSEIEKRFVCLKCSYKGTIWDFIDKEKENIIKTRRNILKMEKDKENLENEKQKLQHEIEELKLKKKEKENESNNVDNTKIKSEKKILN